VAVPACCMQHAYAGLQAPKPHLKPRPASNHFQFFSHNVAKFPRGGVMSFGYSVGDFIAGANLSYQLVKALSDSQGASIEYQEAIAEVGSLQQMFLTVSQMRPNRTLCQATINSAQVIVMSSMTLIGAFLDKTRVYRERLCGRGRGSMLSDSWQKMGWVMFRKDDLRMLRNELHTKLSHISLLLATAQV
jgi:hypothetical protein